MASETHHPQVRQRNLNQAGGTVIQAGRDIYFSCPLAPCSALEVSLLALLREHDSDGVKLKRFINELCNTKP